MAEQAGNLDHISLSGTVCPLLHSASEPPRRQSCRCQDNHQFDHWSIQAAQNLSAQPFQRPANPLVSEYDRGTVPAGLATCRALREMRLSPGANQGPVAILRCDPCAKGYEPSPDTYTAPPAKHLLAA